MYRLSNGKMWKLINWDFAINKEIEAMEFFLLEDSCYFFCVQKNDVYIEQIIR